MIDMKNQTLIITGASSGIGNALARILAARGVNLVLNARRERELITVRNACRAFGVEAECLSGDASANGVAENLVTMAENMGNFFGFIHVAGIFKPGPAVWELDSESFSQIMNASVVAAHRLVRAAVPSLLDAGRGLAVFFGSGAAEKTQPGIAAYCAAKAAEEHLARQLSVEAPDILTLIWRPGVVETSMQRDAREARGACAEKVRTVFRSWKEQGLLFTAEQSALGLVEFLEGTPESYHGRVADIRKVFPAQ